MTRYIDADLLLKQLSKKKSEVAKGRYTEGFNDAIMRVRSMVSSSAAADVVPKSEVVNEIIGHLAGLYDFFKQNDDIREAYAILFAIAELKKKYTEEIL